MHRDRWLEHCEAEYTRRKRKKKENQGPGRKRKKIGEWVKNSSTGTTGHWQQVSTFSSHSWASESPFLPACPGAASLWEKQLVNEKDCPWGKRREQRGRGRGKEKEKERAEGRGERETELTCNGSFGCFYGPPEASHWGIPMMWLAQKKKKKWLVWTRVTCDHQVDCFYGHNSMSKKERKIALRRWKVRRCFGQPMTRLSFLPFFNH